VNRQGPENNDFEERLLIQLRGVVSERATAAQAEEAPAPTATPYLRRRGPRLAIGGGVALAAVTAALVVSAGGDNAPAAYAVEQQPGGGVTIEVYNLGDPEGVEEALEEAGVNSQVSFLEAGMTCREPHYTPSMALMRTLQDHQPQPQPWAGFNYQSADGPLLIAIGDYQQRRQMDEEIHEAYRDGDRDFSDLPSFVIDPTGLRPDQTLVMTSAPAPAGYQQPIPDVPEGVEYTPGTEQIQTTGQVRVAEGEVGPCEPVPATGGEAPIRAPEGGWKFDEAKYAGWGFGLGPRSGE
jgi:hypothetical protein